MKFKNSSQQSVWVGIPGAKGRGTEVLPGDTLEIGPKITVETLEDKAILDVGDVNIAITSPSS